MLTIAQALGLTELQLALVYPEPLWWRSYFKGRICSDGLGRRMLRRVWDTFNRSLVGLLRHCGDKLLAAPIEEETEAVAQGGKCPLGRVGFRGFDRFFVRLPWGWGYCLGGADAFSDECVAAGANCYSHARDVGGAKLGVDRLAPDALAPDGFAIPSLDAENAVGLFDRVPSLDIGERLPVYFSKFDMFFVRRPIEHSGLGS